VNLTERRREKTQINIEIKNVLLLHIPMKYRGSVGNNLKTYIEINWEL
jgi:allophanate hydrolase subunit 1